MLGSNRVKVAIGGLAILLFFCLYSYYTNAVVFTEQPKLLVLSPSSLVADSTNAITPTPTKKLRIAVVVAGTFLRFSLSSFLENVAANVVKQGHSLDYFVGLTIQNAPAYRAEAGYMNYITWDPLFGDTPKDKKLPTVEDIQSTMELSFAKIPNANLRYVKIQTAVDIDKVPEIVEKRKNAQKAYPKDTDLDLRFPMIDLRGKALTRTANANRNMLRLFYFQKLVWQNVVEAEKQDGVPYDYVMIMRDDTEWLDKFDFNLLLQQRPEADVFIPSCNARNPPLHPMEINDHIAITKRNAAAFFGDYFSVLFRPNVIADCAALLQKTYGITFKDRGCNSEMILKYALQKDGYKIKYVYQNYVPMQRVAHVQTKEGLETCFHKYCQSEKGRLGDHGLRKCSLVNNFE
ncbi:hypothetical protein ACA910_021721 [Epithemia clementina (nom. ined.)]